MPWICLKDQYPKAGKYYLFINGNHLPFVGFWKENYGATVDGELCRPTHWMSLPEPPVASNNRDLSRRAKNTEQQVQSD